MLLIFVKLLIFAVMIRVNTPQLFAIERLSLDEGFKKGESHCFRNRYHVVLLKAEGRNSGDIGLITGISYISVNSWVKRFKSEGISGLHNKPGQGSKSVLDFEDKKGLSKSVKRHRQRLQTAKTE
jgi:transposase